MFDGVGDDSEQMNAVLSDELIGLPQSLARILVRADDQHQAVSSRRDDAGITDGQQRR